VVHEWLLNWAGAERQLGEIMRVVPQADLIAGVVSPRLRAEHEAIRKAKETWLARIPGAHTRHRQLIPLQYAAFRWIDTRGYDLVISSSAGFGKAVRAAQGRPHVCYCYSPPRYLWDMAGTYEAHEGRLVSAALRLGKWPLRALDRLSASGVTQFAGISRFVAQRVKRAYGRDATVIYPAVERKPATPKPRENFLLVLGRLVAYKRVDVAIDAAQRLGIPLVIAGEGPERTRLEGRAARGGVTFVGQVTESEAGDLMERCRAFVFCAEEDFGIAPIEANAHGAPVVGLARGALTETMTSDTAEFFELPDAMMVAAAIERTLSRRWDDGLLRANADRFGAERFRREFGEVLSAALQRG
jgi:glycosyltransferase involved in cell wall biosynthesis